MRLLFAEERGAGAADHLAGFRYNAGHTQSGLTHAAAVLISGTPKYHCTVLYTYLMYGTGAKDHNIKQPHVWQVLSSILTESISTPGQAVKVLCALVCSRWPVEAVVLWARPPCFW